MSGYRVFVDTNILLDFYRVRTESGLKLLETLDGGHDRLITTYQVEMEFKKNRQAVIVDSLRNLKSRDKVQHAAFLAESRSAEALNRSIAGANKRIDKFKVRLKKVLRGPTKQDPVYKIAQRLFMHDTPLNLNRAKKVRHQIKRQAFRRFLLGYPPRKLNDTSMGDALNWEWIIQVAKETGDHVVIVSRDSDYGVELDGEAYINDWLIQEFRDRVSKKRQCLLFNRLTPAFRIAKIAVAKDAEEEDVGEFTRPPSRPSQARLWPRGSLAWMAEYGLSESGPTEPREGEG